MKEAIIKTLLNELFDRPLDSSCKTLLVNRDNELKKLHNLISYQPLGIYGLCGETGVGKTTVLRLLEDKFKVFFVVISEKESKEVIIGDLLYKLAMLSKNLDKVKITKKAESILDWVINEKTETIGLQGGIGYILTGEVSKSSSKARRFNLYQAYEILKDLLWTLKSEFGKIVLIIDELDKEKKEDVLQILDSLKQSLLQEDLISIITLPFSIYREYAHDRMRWNETGNLENIFKDMVLIEPLTPKDIQTMILKRLEKHPEVLTRDTYTEIVRFSDGNPRDALWITQQLILDNTKLDRIDKVAASSSIRKIAKEYVNRGKSLTKIQWKILREIADNPGDRATIAKSLSKEVKTQTTYTYITRLINDGFLVEIDGKIVLPGKIYYSVVDK